MSEIIERVEAAAARLAAEQQRIAASLTALGEITHRFDGDSLQDAQEALPALESAVRNFATEVGNLPGHAEDTIEREISAINTAASNALGDLSAHWAVLEKALTQLIEELDRLLEPVTGQLRAFPELLEIHQGQLLAANNELVAAIEGTSGALEGTVANHVNQSIQDLERVLQQMQQYAREGLSTRLEGLVGNAQDQLQRSFADLSQLADRGGQDLQHVAQAAFNAFEDEIQRALEQKLPDAQRELIEHAAHALGVEIIEGITMSTLGAEISTALSPYLAYMIAVKEALELLLEAIRLFKNPLGDII